MIPVKIKKEDSQEEIREKLITVVEDVYAKFNQLNDNVYDFVAEDLRTPEIVTNEAVANLDQTISATPTQSEVQAISDKIDALLVILRNSNLIAP